MNTVIIDIKDGAVQYISSPRGVKVIIRDWDNCPDCGTVDKDCALCLSGGR